jgi:primary-amine oxidase
MPVESTGFMLKPYGFFSQNPGLDIPPGRNEASKLHAAAVVNASAAAAAAAVNGSAAVNGAAAVNGSSGGGAPPTPRVDGCCAGST